MNPNVAGDGLVMKAISEIMQKSHRDCDELFARAEAAVADGNWLDATSAWKAFVSDLEQHITVREEGLLFPAFEKAGGPSGPTFMMRSEHEQMRALVGQINEALEKKDASRFLGLADTLMILIQQHNMKEEQILYPMLDQFVSGLADQLCQ